MASTLNPQNLPRFGNTSSSNLRSHQLNVPSNITQSPNRVLSNDKSKMNPNSNYRVSVSPPVHNVSQSHSHLKNATNTNSIQAFPNPTNYGNLQNYNHVNLANHQYGAINTNSQNIPV